MHTFKTFSVLALAATTALAAPAPSPAEGSGLEAREPGYGGRGNWRGGNRWWYRPQADATVTVTGYGDDSSLPTDTPTSDTPAVDVPAQPEVTAVPDTSSNFRGYGGGNYGGGQPQGGSAPAQPAAQPAAAPSGNTGSISSGGDWFAIANKWRVATGGSPFTEDAGLVANAQNTADSSGGQLTHKLNPGTFAQVLAPGDSSNFESVFVGGWLCELANTPGLNGICSSASQGWNHAGQTGHAEILLSSKYTKIGCALGDGIWSCDLA